MLSEANRKTLEMHVGFALDWLNPTSAGEFDMDGLNRLMDACREEGRDIAHAVGFKDGAHHAASAVEAERSARIRAEARVAELLEALKPFAYQFADDVRDQELVVVAETDEGRFYKVKVSAFRRARSITTGEG